MNLWFLAWLMKKLWTPKRTHEVLGLPRPIAARVLEALEPIDEDTPPELAEQIRAKAQDVFWFCLHERGVPEQVYDLIIGNPPLEHRVQRRLDGRSWTLHEFDDFIDLGLNPRGTKEV